MLLFLILTDLCNQFVANLFVSIIKKKLLTNSNKMNHLFFFQLSTLLTPPLAILLAAVSSGPRYPCKFSTNPTPSQDHHTGQDTLTRVCSRAEARILFVDLFPFGFPIGTSPRYKTSEWCHCHHGQGQVPTLGHVLASTATYKFQMLPWQSCLAKVSRGENR